MSTCSCYESAGCQVRVVARKITSISMGVCLELSNRPLAIVSGSQHLPEGAAPPQGDRRTSPAMDRCAKGEGGVWVNPGGGDRRYSG